MSISSSDFIDIYFFVYYVGCTSSEVGQMFARHLLQSMVPTFAGHASSLESTGINIASSLRITCKNAEVTVGSYGRGTNYKNLSGSML